MVPCLFPTTDWFIYISLCGNFLPWLPVHAQRDVEWSRTRISFIKAVTCGRDQCMQVAMQTDPYINTARCVGIAASPTQLMRRYKTANRSCNGKQFSSV